MDRGGGDQLVGDGHLKDRGFGWQGGGVGDHLREEGHLLDRKYVRSHPAGQPLSRLGSAISHFVAAEHASTIVVTGADSYGFPFAIATSSLSFHSRHSDAVAHFMNPMQYHHVHAIASQSLHSVFLPLFTARVVAERFALAENCCVAGMLA